MAKTGSGLLLVMIDVDPEYEEEFNRWYDEEHLPERALCPGFLTARRWRAVEGGPKYLALYELEHINVLDGPDYAQIAAESPWTQRLSKHFTVTRNVYVDITPTEIPSVVRRG